MVVADPHTPGQVRIGDDTVRFEPLSGAEAEANALAGQLGDARIIRGAHASRGAVESAIAGARLIHVAAHGFALDSDPLASGIVLAGGGEPTVLTARRVATQLRIRSELVVLSACQTGLGRVTGDGVIGLWRAFLASGARAVLATLWSVSDAATEKCMRHFYDAWLVQGEDKARALQRAAEAVRRTPGYEHPFFWAAFVLVGDPEPAGDQSLRRSASTPSLAVPDVEPDAFEPFPVPTRRRVHMSKHPKVCYERVLPKDYLAALPKPLAARGPGRPTRAAIRIAKKWDEGTVLRVRFIGGSSSKRDMVKQFAQQWFDLINLDIVFDDSAGAQIRIAFEDQGAWSYVGTDCLSIPADQPTMNLGWVDEGVILHEFGHTLGLIHEHQSPNAGIDWNRAAVIAALSGPPNFWDLATIEHNMFDKYNDNLTNASVFDTKSVMLYSFPAGWTNDGFHTDPNDTLSETDKGFMGSAYPPNITAPDPGDTLVELEVGTLPRKRSTIAAPDDVKEFKFVADRDAEYCVETEGPCDVIMGLFGADGSLIQEDDDSGRGRNARIKRSLRAGTYKVRVRPYNERELGDFSITVSR